jgi:hypothetical protein
MSLNRVLNRPMFRREALRKGVLKPINANTGVMVGPPTSPAQVPSTKLRKGFQYNPSTGTYINPDVLKYNAKKYATNVGRFGKGLAGMTGMYSGLEALGVPREALLTMGAGEIAGLGLGLSKKSGMQTASKFLTAPTRFAAARSPAMIGLAALAAGGRGVYDKTQQEKLVKEYAKANNISEEKAMNIFNRDMAGEGGRPLSEFSYSDIAKYANKYLQQSPSAAMKLAKPLSNDRGVAAKNTGAKTEREIADELRGYVNFVKDGGGRVYQDVDQLVKKYKEEDIASQGSVSNDQIMMPEDEDLAFSQAKKADENAYKTAETLTQKIMLDTGTDQAKALNIAAALVNGDLSTEEIQSAASSDDIYGKIPNNAGDPNHPDAVKKVNAEEDIKTKVTKDKTVGSTVGADTTDPQINEAKKFAANVDIAQFFEDPRISQTDPNKIMLLKLAAGLLSGTTMKGGLAGVGEILGNALGPAIDAKVLVKMKNDEAYRDWASQVLTYNAALYKSRNDAVKMKLTPGSFAMPDGTFAEARRDKETGDVFISQNGQLIPVNEQEGQFFEQKSDATLFDNVKLIADGYLSDKLLSDSIQLMESNKGKTAIGASGIFVNLIDLAKNIPGELRDGFFGANTSFEMTQGDLSDKEFKARVERANDAVKGLEEGITEFLKNNPEASSVLAKLRVNARMLTYSLANSLKDKDRLTNRDLELIEQLTQTMTAGMTDEKIISQYKNLLQAVREKNKIRIGKLGISGYTQQDTTTILNSMGLGSYAPQFTTQKEFNIDSAQAAFDELMGIK